MALKKFNPTSPGRRFMTTPHLRRDHQGDARRSPSPSPSRRRAAATTAGRITVRFIGRRPQAALPRSSTSGATSAASRPRWRPSSTTPTARRASPCCTTPTARSATSSGPDGLAVGADRRLAARARTSCPATPAAEADPRRHHDPQHRAAPRQGRADGAQRGRRGAARGQGRRLRPGQAALGRGPQGRTSTAMATIGQVGNLEHKNVSFGKAGRKRWLGRRPTTAACR